MLQAKRNPTPRRPRRPRHDVVKAVTAAIELRDTMRGIAAQRREIEAQILAAKSEQRWSGVRSLALLGAISAVLVGLLVAGVST
jgi:hypothetical protein